MWRFNFFSQSASAIHPSSLVLEASDCLDQCVRMDFLKSLIAEERLLLETALQSHSNVQIHLSKIKKTDYAVIAQQHIQVQALRFLRAVYRENEMHVLMACLDNQTKQKMLNALKYIAMDIACRERVDQIGYHPIGEEEPGGGWSDWVPSVW